MLRIKKTWGLGDSRLGLNSIHPVTSRYCDPKVVNGKQSLISDYNAVSNGSIIIIIIIIIFNDNNNQIDKSHQFHTNILIEFSLVDYMLIT